MAKEIIGSIEVQYLKDGHVDVTCFGEVPSSLLNYTFMRVRETLNLYLWKKSKEVELKAKALQEEKAREIKAQKELEAKTDKAEVVIS